MCEGCLLPQCTRAHANRIFGFRIEGLSHTSFIVELELEPEKDLFDKNTFLYKVQ